jgi:hypothetical protein
MMLGKIQNIICTLGRRIAAWRGRHLVSFVDEDPEQVEAGKIYVIGEGGHPWYAAMACPCGCGETIKLAMIEGSRPRWSFVRHWDETVSLKPSVWRKVGCKSHFWIRDGRIHWC